MKVITRQEMNQREQCILDDGKETREEDEVTTVKCRIQEKMATKEVQEGKWKRRAALDQSVQLAFKCHCQCKCHSLKMAFYARRKVRTRIVSTRAKTSIHS